MDLYYIRVIVLSFGRDGVRRSGVGRVLAARWYISKSSNNPNLNANNYNKRNEEKLYQ
jgi:hypothetical protein